MNSVKENTLHTNVLDVNLTRRALLVLVAAEACYACAQKQSVRSVINLGPVDQISLGLQVRTIDRIALLRDTNGVACVSLVCTHQQCLVKPLADGFLCPCHGSTFDNEGKPNTGPATLPLFWYQLALDEKRNLIADPNQSVDADWRLKI